MAPGDRPSRGRGARAPGGPRLDAGPPARSPGSRVARGESAGPRSSSGQEANTLVPTEERVKRVLGQFASPCFVTRSPATRHYLSGAGLAWDRFLVAHRHGD